MNRVVHAATTASLAAALAIAATACSSSGSKASTQSSATSTSAATSTAPTNQPLLILVTNDEGYNAQGTDTVVEALRKLPDVEVRVVATATEQTGQGPRVTEGPVEYHEETTLSGYPAIAVEGHPADTIRVALDELHLKPGLVVSGVNLGQSLGPLLDISGTVGAARAAAARGIPSVAVSQGVGDPVDYPVATAALIDWITEHRGSLTASNKALPTIVNINAPSCGTTGKPRGVVDVPPATSGPPLEKSNCASTLTDPKDDVTALNNGFTVVADIPSHPEEWWRREG